MLLTQNRRLCGRKKKGAVTAQEESTKGERESTSALAWQEDRGGMRVESFQRIKSAGGKGIRDPLIAESRSKPPIP